MAKRITILCILFLSLFPMSAIKAQVNIADSVDNILNRKDLHDTLKIEAINDLARAIASDDQESALDLAEKVINISDKLNYVYGLGRANYIKCLAYYYSGQFTQSIIFAKKSLEYYAALENESLMFDSYNLLAISYGRLGNLDKRLEYLFLCNKIAPDTDKKIVSLINLGVTYLTLNAPSKSLEFLLEAQELAKKINNRERIALIQLNISDAYRILKDYDQAIHYAKQSLEVREELNDLRGIHYSAREIGTILFETGNLNEAANFFVKAGIHAESINHFEGLAYTQMYLAKINLMNNKYTAALNHIDKSNEAIEKTNNKITKLEVLETYVEVYKAKENFKRAFEYHVKSTELKDSIFNAEKSKQIAELQTIYETEKQQQEIEKQQIQLKRQKYFRNSLIAFSFLIVGFVILLYNQFRLKKRTNLALDQKNKELRKLSIVASETSNAVVIFDKQGNIEWFNDAHEQLYDFSFEDFMKNKGKNITEASNNPKIEEHLKYCRQTKKSATYETQLTKHNEKKYIQTTLTPIINENEQIEKFVAIDTDITDLKNAEIEILLKNEEILSQNEEINAQKEELEKHRKHLEKLVEERTKDLKIAKDKAEQSDRLKSAFLANMSHEIRTPMNAIIGFTDLLNEPDLTKEIKEELTRHINHNADTLLKLIDDIIDIAKIESGQLSVNKKEISINTLINNIVPVYKEKRENYANQNITFKVKVPEEDIFIYSDPFRLQQVLINLTDNAFKFTEKGFIEIGVTNNENNTVKFYVKDTGIGITEDKMKIIFRRFSKVEDNKRKLYRGSGLGLAISKNLVELLGGELKVISEKDKGSVFYFDLPITILAENT